jgi:hypothetical protein
MERQHKHKGVERSNGTLRAHPVSRKHKDKKVQQYHNLELANFARTNKSSKKWKATSKAKPISRTTKSLKPKTTKKSNNTLDRVFGKTLQTIEVSIDKDGFVFIDLTKPFKAKGVRVQFQRRNGRHVKTIGVELEK